MRGLIQFTPLFMLAACASMSKEECLTADWRAIGYEDGAYGAPASAITPRRQACAKKIGAAPDMDAYLAGRREGLRVYCTPSNGFAVGARGAVYNGVCDGGSAEQFLASFQTGRRLYQLEAALAGASEAISDKQADQWEIRQRITQVEMALVSPSTLHSDRLDFLIELKQLNEELDQTKHEMAVLERNRDYAAATLEEFRDFLMAEGVLSNGVTRPANVSY